MLFSRVSGLVRAARHSRMSLRNFRTCVPAFKVIPYMLADIGEGIAEAEVLAWHVHEGDHIEEFDALCDVQSDKATADITSRYSGTVVKLHYEVGDMAIVGKPLIDIDVSDDTHHDHHDHQPETTQAPPTQDTTTDTTNSQKAKALMTPAVRRLVKEHNININLVNGSGKDGRILKSDILDFLEGGSSQSAPSTSSSTQASSSETVQAQQTTVRPTQPIVSGEDIVQPIRGVQRLMVKSMTEALKVPHFGYADEIIMDNLMNARQELKDGAAEMGVKLTYMPFFIKAASLALTQYPILNSHVNSECTEVTLRASHNIGVAMDTPNGLIVPNIKNVQAKSIFEIARDLNELQQRGQAGKLTQEDLSGGTFSLSNIGIIGGTYLGPVVVVPEVAIGAIGRIRRVPRFDEQDNVVPVNVMEVSFSADHRVIDGVTIAKFSNTWKGFLEKPQSMLLQLR